MGGAITLNNRAGRALRKKRFAVLAADVLDCAGGFRAGDTVYVTFRGVDGGQYVVASGVVCCDEAALRQMTARARARLPLHDDEPEQQEDANVVVAEQDVQLLWPPLKE